MGGGGGVSEFCRVMKENVAESVINISFPKNVGEGGGGGGGGGMEVAKFFPIYKFFPDIS
jgi:hypothetical protein